jgi:hypothetical protein
MKMIRVAMAVLVLASARPAIADELTYAAYLALKGASQSDPQKRLLLRDILQAMSDTITWYERQNDKRQFCSPGLLNLSPDLLEQAADRGFRSLSQKSPTQPLLGIATVDVVMTGLKEIFPCP